MKYLFRVSEKRLKNNCYMSYLENFYESVLSLEKPKTSRSNILKIIKMLNKEILKQIQTAFSCSDVSNLSKSIAESINNVIRLNSNLKTHVLNNEYDKHTYTYVYDNNSKKCYCIDIPTSYYMKRFNDSWLKLKNVLFTENMLDIIEVNYCDYINKNGQFIS